MAAPTNTEQIQLLRDAAARLDERIKQLQQDSSSTELVLERLTERLADIDKRLAVLESQSMDAKKAAEELARQHWTIIVAIVGSILTLIVNLLLVLLKK